MGTHDRPGESCPAPQPCETAEFCETAAIAAISAILLAGPRDRVLELEELLPVAVAVDCAAAFVPGDGIQATLSDASRLIVAAYVQWTGDVPSSDGARAFDEQLAVAGCRCPIGSMDRVVLRIALTEAELALRAMVSGAYRVRWVEPIVGIALDHLRAAARGLSRATMALHHAE